MQKRYKRRKKRGKITSEIKKEKIRELQNVLESYSDLRIKDLAKRFNLSQQEMKAWLIELLEDGIIKGEFSGSKFIPLEKIDYDQLNEFQAEKKIQCAICFQTIRVQKPSRCNSCDSYYHKDCILEYVKRYKRCPVCSEVLRWI